MFLQGVLLVLQLTWEACLLRAWGVDRPVILGDGDLNFVEPLA